MSAFQIERLLDGQTREKIIWLERLPPRCNPDEMLDALL
jgi:hypothetical protein